MQDLCPLCLKSGLKKKIKLLQINLQEAVWLCEEEKCAWPFGCENFVFCPRSVGKIWSCYWDDNVPPRLKENILSLKPPLYNASLVKDVSAECISSSLDTNPSENNIMTHDVNIIDVKYNNNDLHISVQEEPNVILQDNTKRSHNIDNKTFSNSIDISKSNDNNGKLDNNKMKKENIKYKYENLLSKHIKEKNVRCAQNINTIKNVRKITKIGKSIIDISSVKTDNEISVHQDKQNKNISNVNAYTNIEHNLSSPLSDTIQSITHSSEHKKLSKSESPKNDQLLNEATKTKSNLNVTMMKIDGLPPITLSFEIPVSTAVSETVTCNIEQSDCRTNVTGSMTNSNTKSNTLDIKNTSTKKKITSGRLYEKFSFSAIKKKMETNNSTDVKSNSNNTVNIKPTIKTEDLQNNSINNEKQEKDCIENFHDNQSIINHNKDCKQITSVINITNDYTLNQVNKYEPDLPGQEDVSNSQETILDTTINSAANIENVLTDFLINDYSVSEDINDEWINSLLS